MSLPSTTPSAVPAAPDTSPRQLLEQAPGKAGASHWSRMPLEFASSDTSNSAKVTCDRGRFGKIRFHVSCGVLVLLASGLVVLVRPVSATPRFQSLVLAALV